MPVEDPDGGDDVVLRFKPKLKAAALEGVGRAQRGDVSGMFDVLRAQLFDDDERAKFDALDLDADLDDEDNELVQFLTAVMGLYGDVGKSSGSSTSSNGDGPRSTPTSPASIT